ncbi:MAG: hypothetical protein M3Y87_33505, partial [Myxococcota bacterium]|nr:hypothetical protein [Myxococcota bacterium]
MRNASFIAETASLVVRARDADAPCAALEILEGGTCLVLAHSIGHHDDAARASQLVASRLARTLVDTSGTAT